MVGTMDQQAPNGADYMVQPGGGSQTKEDVVNGITITAGSGSGTPVNGTGGASTPGSTGIIIQVKLKPLISSSRLLSRS